MNTKHSLQKVGLLAFALTGAVSVQRADAAQIELNGQPLATSTQPVTMNGRTLVPMRDIFQALGASVNYNAITRGISATRGNVKIDLQIGNREALVNGTATLLEQPPVLYGGTTLVPLRFVSTALGARVNWNNALQLVRIEADGFRGTDGLPLPAIASNAPDSRAIDTSQTETPQADVYPDEGVNGGYQRRTTPGRFGNRRGTRPDPADSDTVRNDDPYDSGDIVDQDTYQDGVDNNTDQGLNDRGVGSGGRYRGRRGTGEPRGGRNQRGGSYQGTENNQDEFARNADQGANGSSAVAGVRTISVPRGAVVPITLDRQVSSATARVGDMFTATVRSQTLGDSEFPAGTKIEGVISEVRAKSRENPGVLDLDFRNVILPDGSRYPITAELIALDQESVNSTGSGRIMAKNKVGKNDRLKVIGIGAGAGYLLGKVLLKKDGVLSAVLGAAGGYLYDQKKSKDQVREAVLPEGAELGVKLNNGVAYADTTGYSRERIKYIND